MNMQNAQEMKHQKMHERSLPANTRLWWNEQHSEPMAWSRAQNTSRIPRHIEFRLNSYYWVLILGFSLMDIMRGVEFSK
jgi:hypothetical protein